MISVRKIGQEFSKISLWMCANFLYEVLSICPKIIR